MEQQLPSLREIRGRHFLTDLDYEREDLERLLKLAIAIKARRKRRRLTPFLQGEHLAMIFETASTRTRVSFENGFAELGGNALYLRPAEIHFPGRESVADTANTFPVQLSNRHSREDERDRERARCFVFRASHQRHGSRPASLPGDE